MPSTTQSPTRRRVRRSLAAAVALAALTASAPAAMSEPVLTMTPIGGGYEPDTLEEFGRTAALGASGPTVDIVVVPAAYGDADADRAENLELAQSRTDQIDAACDKVVPRPYTGCTAVLAPILNRVDALTDSSSSMIGAGTDGIYVLGGDQGLAMSVLANSPAEARISAAYRSGTHVGGTSAGAAVESLSMINGYSGDDVYPWDGLQRGSTLMWWGGDGDAERGLRVGSLKAIFDQHFFQRGRFGRLLSTVAESDARFGGKSLLGVGVDYATGVRNTNDATLSGVFGASAAAVIDLESDAVTPTWVGAKQLLSAQGIRTHLMTPGDVRYVTGSRAVIKDGRVVAPLAKAAPWTGPSAPRAAGTIFLGGDVSGETGAGSVLADFVATAQDSLAPGASSGAGTIVIVAPSADDRAAARAYAADLKAAGWTGATWVLVKGDKALTGALRVAGVVFVGETPKSVSGGVGNAAFASIVRELALRTPAVLADRHMAAAFGPRYSLKDDPTSDNYEDEAIANFLAGDGNWRTGLGIVGQSVVPSLGYDYRWGKLYDHGLLAPNTIIHGVDVGTAIRVTADPADATVVGTGSVVSLNPRRATWWTGSNGVVGAANVFLSVWAPGQKVTGGR